MSSDMEARALLQNYPPAVADLAMETRTYVMKTVPDATETADVTANLLGYGIAPGYKGLVCTILLSRTGVKLGISGSASFDDPASLLEGTGKKHKYVQIKSPDVLKNPALHDLLVTAAQRARAHGG